MADHYEAVHGTHGSMDWALCELAKALWDTGRLADDRAEEKAKASGRGRREEAVDILRGVVNRRGGTQDVNHQRYEMLQNLGEGAGFDFVPGARDGAGRFGLSRGLNSQFHWRNGAVKLSDHDNIKAL